MSALAVYSIPTTAHLNPYISVINRYLEQRGVAFPHPGYDLDEIRRILRPRAILHFHWPSLLYSRPTHDAMRAAVADWAAFLNEAKAANASIVWTAHNLWPHESRFPDLDEQARRLLVAHSGCVIAHCESAGAALESIFGKARRMRVIRHPCYEVNLAAPLGQTLRTQSGGLVLLSFGVLRAYKNLEFLAQTFQRHAAPADRLIVAGAAHHSFDPARLRTLCAQDKRITLSEREVPEEELGALFGAADVAVFAYTRIQSSGAVALAQSFGKPVIAPRLGCMPDAITPDAGELYDAGRPDSLGDALARIRKRDLGQLGARSQALVRRETPRSFAAKLHDIYAELVAP